MLQTTEILALALALALARPFKFKHSLTLTLTTLQSSVRSLSASATTASNADARHNTDSDSAPPPAAPPPPPLAPLDSAPAISPCCAAHTRLQNSGGERAAASPGESTCQREERCTHDVSGGIACEGLRRVIESPSITCKGKGLRRVDLQQRGKTRARLWVRLDPG